MGREPVDWDLLKNQVAAEVLDKYFFLAGATASNYRQQIAEQRRSSAFLLSECV
jgi:hypothetical protein